MTSLPLVHLMNARRYELTAAIAGLKATGVPLVGLDHGRLFAAGISDSSGMYFFVSLLARATGLSPDAAATVFFYGILAAALAVGAWSWCVYARGLVARLLGIIALVPLTLIALHFGDDYILLAALPLACVPSLLILWRRGASRTRWTWVLAAVGLAAGFGSLIRAESGLPVLAFAGVVVAMRTRETRARRALQVGALLLAFAVPAAAMRVVQLRRDAFLARAVPGYEPPPPAHVLWHAMYIGYGFLTNDRGLAYNDEVGGALVQRVAPGTPPYSRRYNQIVRDAVLRLVLDSPAFVARTIFAKAGVLLMYLVVFANVGLIAAVLVRKPPALELPFLAAAFVAALPGVLIFPVLHYMEGFTTLAVLYGLSSLDWALAQRRSSA